VERVLQMSIEEVRERFKKDRYAVMSGAYIDEVAEGYAKCSLKIEDMHLNAVGTVMGGVMFTLADFAYAVAANWNQEIPCVSLSSSISFLGVAKGEHLIAEARVKKDGRTTAYYEVEIRDDLDRLVAQVSINGFKKA